MSVTAQEIHEKFMTAMNSVSFDADRITKLNRIGLTTATHNYEAQLKYSGYKLIHRNQVLLIAQEYNLVFADLEKFIGHIPDKNLDETFQFCEKHVSYKVYWSEWFKQKSAVFKTKEEARKKGVDVWPSHDLYIVAPEKLLNIRPNERVVGNQIVVDDPVILAAERGNYDLYIIVTAWGPEAKDERVFNEKQN
jgi:hypothetical protein